MNKFIRTEPKLTELVDQLFPKLKAHLRLHPLGACVKVGDTVADMEEGRSAGMWTVGVAETRCVIHSVASLSIIR